MPKLPQDLGWNLNNKITIVTAVTVMSCGAMIGLSSPHFSAAFAASQSESHDDHGDDSDHDDHDDSEHDSKGKGKDKGGSHEDDDKDDHSKGGKKGGHSGEDHGKGENDSSPGGSPTEEGENSLSSKALTKQPPPKSNTLRLANLGRLSVVQLPEHVLERARLEALAMMDAKRRAFYNQSLSKMVETLSRNQDDTAFYVSPLQNVALLRDVLDGNTSLSKVGVTNKAATLSAAFLGMAADRTTPISTETVMAVSAAFDKPISRKEAAALASDADRIRQAVRVSEN
jgi:hypothetical protein